MNEQEDEIALELWVADREDGVTAVAAHPGQVIPTDPRHLGVRSLDQIHTVDESRERPSTDDERTAAAGLEQEGRERSNRAAKSLAARARADVDSNATTPVHKEKKS